MYPLPKVSIQAFPLNKSMCEFSPKTIHKCKVTSIKKSNEIEVWAGLRVRGQLLNYSKVLTELTE